MTSVEAFIAAHRFGLGPRPGELVQLGNGARDWVLSQIRPDLGVPKSLTGRPTSRERLAEITAKSGPDKGAAKMSRRIGREVSVGEVTALFSERIVSPVPFAERMVAFWANHFSVDRGKGFNVAVASTLSTEAIRPHLFGRFEDLLFAATTHPAMLIYLDNILSVGPNSLFGKRQGRDVNENLAREVLELHTLGVNGGYTQQDVEALAAILTGWIVPNQRFAKRAERIGERMGLPTRQEFGMSTFNGLLHEPGSKTLLGKTYAEAGAEEYRSVTRDLARHPATATFIATKLVRHFVADIPPVEDVARVAKVFLETEGDLGAVTRAVVELESAWASPLAKAKTPQEYIVAVHRAFGRDRISTATLNGALLPMGQRPLSAPSPQGWPDTAEAWVAPGSLMARIEYARATAARVGDRVNPQNFLANTLGDVAGDDTLALVRGAPSGEEAVAFILASREFQRR